MDSPVRDDPKVHTSSVVPFEHTNAAPLTWFLISTSVVGGRLDGLVCVRCSDSDTLITLSEDGSMTTTESIPKTPVPPHPTYQQLPHVTPLDSESCLVSDPFSRARNYANQDCEVSFLSIPTFSTSISPMPNTLKRKPAKRLTARFGTLGFSALAIHLSMDSCISSGTFVARSEYDPWTLHTVRFV